MADAGWRNGSVPVPGPFSKMGYETELKEYQIKRVDDLSLVSYALAALELVIWAAQRSVDL